MTSDDVVLTAEHLTKRIGKRIIVDDASFDVRRGEIFGFLGPNGAGKTTTIRMLVGLIRPTAGKIRICGFDIEREFEKATRCIGAIIESPDLYRFMSGRENLEHFARMLGIEANGEIERVATLVNLEQRLNDRVRTYSLGMRQRLGIAQALLGDPKLLILDEPANGLDPAGIREIRHLLRSLAAEHGLSIFISSHLLAEVELMCDRVAIIHRGKILETGSVRDLISQTSEVEIRVDDAEAAVKIAAQSAFASARDPHTLVVAADENDVPQLVAALVASGIAVSRVERKLQTLEEKFLETTGGETVGA